LQNGSREVVIATSFAAVRLEPERNPMSAHAVRRFTSLFIVGLLCAGLAGHAQAVENKPRKQVIVLVGLPGAGKTTLARGLSKAMGGVPRLRCSKVLRKWIKDQGLPLSKETDEMASKVFAQTPGRLLGELSKTIERSRKPVHIVDGVRSKADLKVLQSKFDVQVLALTLPKAERYRRLAKRARYGDTEAAAFEKRDRREIGLGVLHVMRAPFRRVDMGGPMSAVPGIAAQLAQDLAQARK
jgi:dephospho-CoA kinase